jgi:hypothetical protein
MGSSWNNNMLVRYKSGDWTQTHVGTFHLSPDIPLPIVIPPIFHIRA